MVKNNIPGTDYVEIFFYEDFVSTEAFQKEGCMNPCYEKGLVHVT